MLNEHAIEDGLTELKSLCDLKRSYKREELSTLNPAQVKAFNSLKRAFKKCEDSGIMFYSVRDYLHAVNGDEVLLIDSECCEQGGVEVDEVIDLSYNIVNNGLDSFADDTHYTILK